MAESDLPQYDCQGGIAAAIGRRSRHHTPSYPRRPGHIARPRRRTRRLPQSHSTDRRLRRLNLRQSARRLRRSSDRSRRSQGIRDRSGLVLEQAQQFHRQLRRRNSGPGPGADRSRAAMLSRPIWGHTSHRDRIPEPGEQCRVTDPDTRINVTILFGGQSGEHDVSLRSAQTVIRALDPAKYNVRQIGITRDGGWITSGSPMDALTADSPLFQLAAESSQPSAATVDVGPPALSSDSTDVVFPVLHGPYGEDGTIQGMLEVAGIPYVGSGVLGSAVGMDKDAMKRLFLSYGLPFVPYICFSRGEWRADPSGVQRLAEERLTYPMFAKPSNMGSSVGVGKIHGPGEFAAAVEEAARYDRRVMVEQGVDARECECGVLGGDRPQTSVVGEIVPGNEFYDYRAKYVDDNSDLIIPADLPESITREIQRVSLAAFRAIDAWGMARVDFFVARDLSQVWLNEINTIPGFTLISMYPKLWEASGLPYPALVDRLIELAIERHNDRLRNKAALDDPGGDLTV